MKILMATSEMAPLAKTGGLADVAGSLPHALAALGHEIAVVMPFYGTIDRDALTSYPVLPEVVVDLPAGRRVLTIWRTRMPTATLGSDEERAERPSITIYLVEDDGLFARPQLYAEQGEEYPDNPLRFAYFCQAAVWMLKGLDWLPDVIHCNDWQTALIPVYLDHYGSMRNDPALQHIRVLLAIHNLSYQGIYPPHVLGQIGLPDTLMNPEELEFYGSVNLLKGGICYSHRIVTVSRQYAREIQTEQFGCGLEGVLSKRTHELTGILNGIDVKDWNPATDPHLAANFSREDPTGKTQCKEALQKQVGLPVQPERPLIGMISRLADQKGLDLISEVLPELLASHKFQFVVLGTGQPEYHEFFQTLQNQMPDRVAARLLFDNALAHQIEAGADMFLMPSAFEPCGLNQMYSMRYGTIPIVRWRRLMQNAMSADFGWTRSAREYEHLMGRMIHDMS